MIANILSIAGSDPSGGAGIQADLKAFSARGTYGMAAITALTAQNTCGVSAIHLCPTDFIKAQIDAVFDDVEVHGVKIGMIANGEIAKAVAEVLSARSAKNIVVDPVMVAKGGAKLLEDQAAQSLIDHLLPIADIITPNLPEAAVITGKPVAKNRAQMRDQAEALVRQGAKAVLLKGGHLEASESPDLLAFNKSFIWLEGSRIATANTHGTGCSLSSAVAAELGKGSDVETAVRAAKSWLTQAIKRNADLNVGKGHGPVHHFHNLW